MKIYASEHVIPHLGADVNRCGAGNCLWHYGVGAAPLPVQEGVS